MSNVTIRIPVSKTLKSEAEAASRSYGFTSLKDALTTLLAKFAKREIALEKPEEKVIHLSKRAIKQYDKIARDMEAGKNVYYAKDIDDFIEQLKRA